MKEILIPCTEENSTPSVVDALRTAEDGSVILLEKGVYHFYADGCYTGYFSPVCNQSGEKRVIFPLFRRKNITLDGQGAELLFHDRVFPFLLADCDGITLKNFSVNFSFPRYCMFNCTPAEDGLYLSIDAETYPFSVNDAGNLSFTAGDSLFTTGEKVFFMEQRGSAVCYLKVGETAYQLWNLPAPILSCDAERTNDGVFLRYRPDNAFTGFAPGRVMLNYDEDRQNDCFFFESCRDIRMEKVSVYRGAGMGTVFQLCENIELDRVVLQPGKNGDEDYSTTADGFFFTNCTGKVWIHGCKIDSSMDDAISIHGIYTSVDTVLTDRRIRTRYRHNSHSGYNLFRKGDRVTVTDSATGRETGFCTVKASYMGRDTDTVLLDLDEDISSLLKPGDLLNLYEKSPEVVIEGCTFRNFPHIRLSSAQKIAFRHNFVINAFGVSVNDLPAYWYAYGKSADVTFIGNQFISCDTAVHALIDRPEGHGVRHGRIVLMKNLFRSCKHGYALSHVEKVITVGHSVVDMDDAAFEHFEDCPDVTRPVIKQLLMRRDTVPFTPTPLPDGFSRFTFHRGGDERMSMDEYIENWFRVDPFWSRVDFDRFYQDDRIPEDGHFLILDAKGKAVAHSNVQIAEHKPGTATVHFVSVADSCRGKRLGYCISEAVLDYAEKHSIPILYLTTDEHRIPALKIYLKLGFRPVLWDDDMADRWFPILRLLGYHEYYDADENLLTLD